MSIKYHQNGIGNEYGADYTLTNNWNPDCDYGNEYVNVYFRMETKGYNYPSFCFTEEDEKAFDTELVKVFTALGWKCEEEAHSGSCATWTKGKQHLYLHPQDFSGEVLKNEVKQIAEALEKNNSFYLRWVDLYDTVYDISDSDYEKYLDGKKEEIRKKLFENSATTRTTKYYAVFDVVRHIAGMVRLNRLGLNDGRNYGSGQTIDYILKVAKEMITEGYLKCFEKNGQKYIRSLNKTEQKRSKLKFAC